MRTAFSITAVLLTLVATGCQRAIVDTPNPAPLAAEAYDRTFDVSIDVLRDRGFVVEQQDYRFGRVTTQPKDSPTALEPWHADNSTPQQAWQSTLDHQRRTVSLFFEPMEGAEDYHLRVEVLLERRVQPPRRLTGRTDGNVFGSLEEVPAEWRRRGIDSRYWEPVGRDAYLENRLMREITARAATSGD